MKLKKILGFVFVAMFLMTAVSMEAAKSKSEVLFVPYEASVAGKSLSSGNYRVKYETNGSNATLTFQLGHKVIATIEGKVANRSEKYVRNEVVYNINPNGSRSIVEIRLVHPSQVVVFND